MNPAAKPIATVLLAQAPGSVAPSPPGAGPLAAAAGSALKGLPALKGASSAVAGVGSAASAAGSAAAAAGSAAAGAGSAAAAAGSAAGSFASEVERAAQGVPWSSVLVWLVPIGLAAALAALGWWWWRRRKRPAAAAAPASASAQALPSDLLLKAWRRFVADLPPAYRRSLVNFEHFVVLGAAAGGKTRLVDAYTDWRRQSKQLAVSRPHDPDLPVYVASGAIVVELPARFLGEVGVRGRRALERLFRSVYRQRAPTVVVALDAAWLRASAPGAIVELAESVRARVNLIASARRRPVEVRVALTRLDAAEGYAEFARFCREQGLTTQLPFASGEGAKAPAEQAAAWLASLREQLPRALVHLPSADYLRAVAFVRRAPELGPPLGAFLGALFAPEALSNAPRPGAVYLTSDPPGRSNPFEPAAERGAAVDPRRPHLALAAALAAAAVAYLGLAYAEQRARYDRAEQAFAGYNPAAAGGDDEARRRGAVVAFLRREGGFFGQLHYFSAARAAMRKAFAERVRDRFLEPRLQKVARQGAATAEAPAMPVRRSAYYLALIHSDKTDPLGLLSVPGRLELAAAMTELPEAFVRDYVESVDERRTEPVAFELGRGEEGPADEGPALLRFLDEFKEALERPEGVTFAHLRGMRARAEKLGALLRRAEHDRETEALLGSAGPAVGAPARSGAAGATPAPTAAGLLGLEPSYEPKFLEYLRFVREYRVDEQARELSELLSVVLARREAIARGASSIEALVEGLEGLVEAEGPAGHVASFSVAGRAYVLDVDRWREALRSVDAREQIDDFLESAGSAIFFRAEAPAAARAPKAGAAKARPALAPRYTRQAYDEHVRRPVLRLDEVLGKTGLSDAQKQPLSAFVRDAVRDYAAAYAAQSRALVHGFAADAGSVEGLRALLAQMVKPEGSAFDDLLKSVDENTRLGCESTMLEPACDAMAEFAGWHAVVGVEGGAPEVVKYRAILAQLLADLGPAEGGAAAAPAAGPETLERSLSPAGKLALAEIKGEKGSYARLVGEWAAALDLPDYQRRVFAGPVAALSRLGGDEIGRELDRAFRAEMLPDLRRLADRFPFRADAKEDASAADVEAVFHPQKGRFFDAFRRHFEPLYDFGDGGPFAVKRAASGKVKLPPHLTETVNAAAALAARLWDDKGAPVPTPVRVSALPFERGRDPKLAPSLAHLSAGAATLVYFNQKPAPVTLRLEWNAEYASQAGLELTDVATGERSFADPFAAEKSPWSFFRLLRQAKAEPSRLEPGAQTYTFRFKIGDAGSELPVRFVVFDDPTSAFAIGNLVRSKVTAAPKRAGR
ncbi:MAG TPA: type VI secretion protein IcmF/TssM N-terminal domain-containing protein [Polyangiaceae bacterium]|nr:type VI secretion protein IcmF/TssM N-terminal domain-containing protein [Polyangiaceae bacterium]